MLLTLILQTHPLQEAPKSLHCFADLTCRFNVTSRNWNKSISTKVPCIRKFHELAEEKYHSEVLGLENAGR